MLATTHIQSEFTANKLVYYPELARKVRGLPHKEQNIGQRQVPLLQNMTENHQGWITQVAIYGLQWNITIPSHSASDTLDLHRLFRIERNIFIFAEDIIPGSPLIALYMTKDSQSRHGRLVWYNLDTQQPGALSDAVRY